MKLQKTTVFLIFTLLIISEAFCSKKEKSKEKDIKKFTKKSCDNVKQFVDFGAKGKFMKILPHKVEKTEGQLCGNLKYSCCDKKVMKLITNWWQGKKPAKSKNTCNRKGLREHRQLSILFYTKYIQDNVKNYKKYAQTIMRSKYGLDDSCRTASIFFLRNVQNHPIESKAFHKDYLQKQFLCFEFMNKMHVNLLCKFCKPDFMNTVNMKEQTVFLNDLACQNISVNCKDSIENNLYKLYPILRLIEPLSRCTKYGEADYKLNPIMINSTGSIDSSINEKLTKVQCERAISFGTKMNYNTEGDVFFMKNLYERTRNLFRHVKFAEIQRFLSKKPMARLDAVEDFEQEVITFYYPHWQKLRIGLKGDMPSQVIVPQMTWLETKRHLFGGWMLPHNRQEKELKEFNLVYPRNPEVEHREYDFKKEIKDRLTKNSERIIGDKRLMKDIPKSTDSLTRIRLLRKKRNKKGKKSKEEEKVKITVSDLKFLEETPQNCEKILKFEISKKLDVSVFEKYQKKSKDHPRDAIVRWMNRFRGDCGGYLKGTNDQYNAVRESDISFSTRLYHEYQNIDTDSRTANDPHYDLENKEMDGLYKKKVESFNRSIKDVLNKNTAKFITQVKVDAEGKPILVEEVKKEGEKKDDKKRLLKKSKKNKKAKEKKKKKVEDETVIKPLNIKFKLAKGESGKKAKNIASKIDWNGFEKIDISGGVLERINFFKLKRMCGVKKVITANAE